MVHIFEGWDTHVMHELQEQKEEIHMTLLSGATPQALGGWSAPVLWGAMWGTGPSCRLWVV